MPRKAASLKSPACGRVPHSRFSRVGFHVRTLCIDTADFNRYAVFSRVACDLRGTRTRTAGTCASMTFALRQPFSFSTIPTRLRDETTTRTMRSAG